MCGNSPSCSPASYTSTSDSNCGAVKYRSTLCTGGCGPWGNYSGGTSCSSNYSCSSGGSCVSNCGTCYPPSPYSIACGDTSTSGTCSSSGDPCTSSSVMGYVCSSGYNCTGSGTNYQCVEHIPACIWQGSCGASGRVCGPLTVTCGPNNCTGTCSYSNGTTASPGTTGTQQCGSCQSGESCNSSGQCVQDQDPPSPPSWCFGQYIPPSSDPDAVNGQCGLSHSPHDGSDGICAGGRGECSYTCNDGTWVLDYSTCW